MIFLITMIISALVVTWWIKIANKYAYDNIVVVKKARITNAMKLVLYAACLLPIANIVLIVVFLPGLSFTNYEWKNWEENKILYWLFKK